MRISPEEMHRMNFVTDSDGVQWVCRGYHNRADACEWELASANLLARRKRVGRQKNAQDSKRARKEKG